MSNYVAEMVTTTELWTSWCMLLQT